MSEYAGRSVEFGGDKSLDNEEYIFVFFKRNGEIVAKKFAPYRLDCELCITDWMLHEKITVEQSK